jgi:peptide/nickel transport system substrate-binding protein
MGLSVAGFGRGFHQSNPERGPDDCAMSKGSEREMKRYFRVLAVAGGMLISMFAAAPTFAQKQGGILKLSHFDSPASMSIFEESTGAALQRMMGIFNNLVMYKQDTPQTSLQSVTPDLATGWSWNEDGTELTFPLRQGVKWHDGKPFTA